VAFYKKPFNVAKQNKFSKLTNQTERW